MKKLLIPILLFALASCTKTVEVYTYVNTDNAVLVKKDTTITGVWDGHDSVLRITNARIKGNGILKNWIIDAALTQWIFDTTITLQNCKTYGDRFSCMWYGASPSNANNWWNIQKSIYTCIDNNIRNCFLPSGKYDYAWTLRINKTTPYQSTSLHFFGDANFWDPGQGTILNFTLTGGSAFNLQYNKGSEVDHISLTGKWKAPGGNDSTYYNLTEANYKDASGNNIGDFHRGFCIDGDAPPFGTSGSTGNSIHDIYIGGFARAISMSENGVTYNNDIEIFNNIHFGDCKYGFVCTQAQEKGNVVRGLYSWGSVYSLINIGTQGKAQAGNYTFDGGNVAGRCINLLNVNQGAWFSSSLKNFFCESIKSIGNIFTSIPFVIETSHFDFKFPSQIGQRIVLNNNSAQTQIRDCTLRFYNGQPGEIWVHSPSATLTGNNNNFYLQTLIYK